MTPLTHPACQELKMQWVYPGRSHAAGTGRRRNVCLVAGHARVTSAGRRGVSSAPGWDGKKPVPGGGRVTRHPRLPLSPKGRLRLSPAARPQGVKARELCSALQCPPALEATGTNLIKKQHRKFHLKARKCGFFAAMVAGAGMAVPEAVKSAAMEIGKPGQAWAACAS